MAHLESDAACERQKADAAYKRLKEAVDDSIKELKSDIFVDRYQYKLDRAVEVHAAAQQALQFSTVNGPTKHLLDHPWAKAALRRVKEAAWISEKVVAEMVRKADANYIVAEKVRKAAQLAASRCARVAPETAQVAPDAAKADAAYKRLKDAVNKSVTESKSDVYKDRWKHKLDCAVEVEAAAQQALPLRSADSRIQHELDHPWARAARLRVAEVRCLDKDVLAEMLRIADAKHAAFAPTYSTATSTATLTATLAATSAVTSAATSVATRPTATDVPAS